VSDLERRHHIVIVGAGFGGLEVARRLAGAPVRVTIIDQRNHHLFQPLLYQVATASLAPSEIAWPVRHLFRNRKEVTTLLALVTGIDASSNQLFLKDGTSVQYDTLVLATGARHAYFGHDDWELHAPGLKTLEDATAIRRHILVAFEEAEREQDSLRRAAMLTFVIVGGGPTGVELAGTIAELAHGDPVGGCRRHHHCTCLDGRAFPHRQHRFGRGRKMALCWCGVAELKILLTGLMAYG